MIISVTDRRSCSRPFLDQIRSIAESGPDMIILRDKNLDEDGYRTLASECLGICSDMGVELSVHSFADVATELGVDRLHLTMKNLREIGRPSGIRVLGASIHSSEEAIEASSLGADYVIFGHVFETSCKPDLTPRGLSALKDICRISDIPVYAIGGISPENARSVIECGADGICIMSSLMSSEDPTALMRELKNRIG